MKYKGLKKIVKRITPPLKVVNEWNFSVFFLLWRLLRACCVNTKKNGDAFASPFFFYVVFSYLPKNDFTSL